MKNYKRAIDTILKNGIKGTINKIINIRRQEKFLKYYYDKNTLLKAIKIGEKIVKMFPDDLYNYQKLARAYWKNKDVDNATNTLRRGIKVNYNIELDEMICEIEKSISNKSLLIANKFIFKGGHQNYGLIEHTFEEKTLLTKILTLKQSKGEFIVQDLQQKYITFNNITPSIIKILTIKDLCFITMEKIEGEEPKLINTNLIEKVYEINSSITSVKYGDLSRLFNEQIVSQYINPINRIEIFKTFYQVNQNNKEIFSIISEFLIKNNYPLKSLKIIDYLNDNIVVHNFHEHIIPEHHFTLQHGDFLKDNMLMNNQSGDLKVIDWGGIRVGPRWVDLAVFLGVTKQPFYEILQNFLEHKRCDYDPVEKLFFIYTLIVTWIVIFNKEEIEDFHQIFCRPALLYFEALMIEIKKGEAIKTTS